MTVHTTSRRIEELEVQGRHFGDVEAIAECNRLRARAGLEDIQLIPIDLPHLVEIDRNFDAQVVLAEEGRVELEWTHRQSYSKPQEYKLNLCLMSLPPAVADISKLVFLLSEPSFQRTLYRIHCGHSQEYERYQDPVGHLTEEASELFGHLELILYECRYAPDFVTSWRSPGLIFDDEPADELPRTRSDLESRLEWHANNEGVHVDYAEARSYIEVRSEYIARVVTDGSAHEARYMSDDLHCLIELMWEHYLDCVRHVPYWPDARWLRFHGDSNWTNLRFQFQENLDVTLDDEDSVRIFIRAGDAGPDRSFPEMSFVVSYHEATFDHESGR